MFNRSDWAVAGERRREQIEQSAGAKRRRRRFNLRSILGDHG